MKRRVFSLFLALILVLGGVTPLGAPGGTAQAAAFRDVSSGAWYADYVRRASEEGLMAGTSEDRFSPDTTLTRAMFVTILGRLHQVDPDDYRQSTAFVDAPKDSWYGPYVNWASQHDIVSGYGTWTFGSDDPITREQMASILARYLEFLDVELPDGEDTVSSFRDSGKVSNWARQGVELMRRTGILAGDQNRNFRPGATALRSEAATLFVRLMDALAAAQEETVTFAEDSKAIIALYEDSTLTGYAEDYVSATTDSQRREYANEIFNYFRACEDEGTIQDLSWNQTENVFYFESATGILCMYELQEEEDVSVFGAPAGEVYAGTTTQTSNGTYLSGKKAVILSGFPKTTNTYTETYLDLIGILGNAETRPDLSVDYRADATVADFRSLDDPTVVVVNSHGALYNGTPVICLEEAVTSYKNQTYQNLLNQGYIGFSDGTNSKHSKYIIFPSFFTGIYGSDGLEGSLVHLCCCDALSNDQLANALLAAGAETVSGYTASVQTTYDRSCTTAYFRSLMEGKSVAVAYTDATKAVNGKQDTYAGATFQVKGNRSVYLVSSSQLTGTVFNQNSVGIAGATVTLKAGGQTLATAKTASDGSYSLPCSWDKTSYTLLVQADGFADKEDLLYTQVATHDVTLTPSARGALKITVKSADGENLGLYNIHVKNQSGTTVWKKSDGFSNQSTATETATDLTLNTEYKIEASASFYTAVNQSVRVSQDGQSVEIELYRGTYGFKGKVVDDATGRPIQGVKAELTAKSGNVYGTATTDSTGSFQVMGKAGLVLYTLRLSGNGYETMTDLGSGKILSLNEPVDLGTIRMTAAGGSTQPVDPEPSQPVEPSQPEQDGEYTLIYTAEDLTAISSKSGQYKLANDLDLTDYPRSVVGLLTKDTVLDGGGHTLRINQRNQFFGGVISSNYGTIRNLNVTGTAIFEDEGTSEFGGICGINYGLIENCSFNGTIRSSTAINNNGSLSQGIGGICGRNSGTVRNCTVSGSISLTLGADGWGVGGICGDADTGSVLENCINRATVSVQVTGGYYEVSRRAYVGGICGYSNGYEDIYITDCLNTANITAKTTKGTTRAAGVCAWSGTLEGCANTGACITATGTYFIPTDPYSGSIAYGVGQGEDSTCYCSDTTTLVDATGTRSVAEDSNLILRTTSEILEMW